MYISDIEIRTRSVNATSDESDKRIRLAQFCPANTDVSMWLKRIVQLLFELTGNNFTLPATNITLDHMDNVREIRLAPGD